MAGKIKYEKTFISCGDTVCIDVIKVRNKSKIVVNNATVHVDTPKGLVFLTSSLPKGAYDENTGIWTVGILFPGEELKPAQFCYQVAEHVDQNGDTVDIDSYTGSLSDLQSGSCLAPYIWNIVIDTGCEDCNPTDNDYCITLGGLTCCQIKKCTSSGALNCELLTP